MKIILKNSFKNIFKKPLRTFLMTFSIFLCVLSALFCIDIGDSLGKLVEEVYGNVATADLMIESKREIDLPENISEYRDLPIYINKEIVYKEIESEIAFVNKETYSIYGLDPKAAYDMKFIDFNELQDNETVITSVLAQKYGYQKGDTIIFHDRANGEHEFKIRDVLPSTNSNPLLKTSPIAIVNLEANDMLSFGVRNTMMMLVDFDEDADLEANEKILKNELTQATVSELKISKEDMKTLSDIKVFFYIVFAISFLLVIFVTISISERIVSERMSFIGTLRSLGMSMRKTCFILLLENILYALIGAIPGIVLYLAVRAPLLSSIMRIETAEGGVVTIEVGPISFLIVAGVFIASILVECLVPLKAILKALKTSIRDIIFDNRDTEYKYSKKLTLIGVLLLAVSVICCILSSNLVVALICIISAVTSIALLFPIVFKKISEWLKVVFDKLNMTKWSFATVEAGTRKSTVGSGIMCVTAAALCVVIYAVGMAELVSLNYTDYNYDVTVDCSGRASTFSFIDHLDGVNETERLYIKDTYTSLNDSDSVLYTYFFGMPEGGFKFYDEIKGIPDKIEKGTIYVNKRLSGIEDIKVGDTIKLTINPDGVVPFIREYKIAGFFEGTGSAIMGRTFVIPQDEYIGLFHDEPGRILIKCDNPDHVASMIRIYGKDAASACKTKAELIEENRGQSSGLITVFIIIIIMGLSMTIIGVTSNQIIGFEGRKKESAVLLSTAMNKKTLMGILLKESFMVSVVSGAVGTLLGVGLAKVFKNALDHTESIVMDINTDPDKCLLFFAILVIVFTFTVLFPIRNLRKMKISEQIKYE